MLLTHANLATMEEGVPYGWVADGAVWLKGETIAWAGAMADIPRDAGGDEVIDLEGRVITPGLVDCHTHIVHAGNRAGEFERRLQGASYEEIARAGGGILSTVEATRDADDEELLELALLRVDALIAEGVTTLEIKSGYGLDIETELKMLRIARAIGECRPVRILTSLLAAHTLPPRYAGRADDYIDEVCLPALEAGRYAGLVDAVDGYCESIAFTPAQIRRLFDRARDLGVPVKLHAEQLSPSGGTRLAAEYGALSCDHLEYAEAADIAAMAGAGTVAVLLPGAFYVLGETRRPPVDLLRRAGVPMALATDCNPGTSPLH